MRTSESHPIYVDFLPREACALPGRIGLTFAPGKKDPRRDWDRDLDADLARLIDHDHATLLVSLVEDHELKLLDIERLPWAARDAGLRVRRLPIVDVDVPRSMADVIEVVRIIIAVASAGDTVVIHCRGGLGRAGTIASCCLVALGHGPDEAIRIVRAARAGAVETPGQERFVASFGLAWRETGAVTPSSGPFVACLLGGALGDALGYPVEFLQSAADIERVLGSSAPPHLPRRTGHRAVVSDDTQMTLFTAEGIIRAVHRGMDRGPASPEVVLLRAYQRWLTTQTGQGAERWRGPTDRGWLLDVPELQVRRAPGNTCLSALIKSLGTNDCPTVETPPNDSKGCGAIMRSAPIGLAARTVEVAFTLARDVAVLTHGHPSGYLSAAYFAAVIHGVARDVPLRAAMETADALLAGERGREEVETVVARARALAAKGTPSRAAIEELGGGWVGEEALAISLLCALTVRDGAATSFAEALYRAVAHAGDSDSTGSLTGNLLGAMYGPNALPKAWVDDIEMRPVIERLAVDLHASTVLEFQPDTRRYPPT
jgi:ADP-ribosylglycohydrolase/protein-tyrosine phosphatase